MMPKTAARLILHAFKLFVNEGNYEILCTKGAKKAVRVLLYKAMKSEGINVKMVDGCIDVGDIQEEFMFMFDLQNKVFTSSDAWYISDRFINHPYRLYHLHMALQNGNILDDNEDRFLKL